MTSRGRVDNKHAALSELDLNRLSVALRTGLEVSMERTHNGKPLSIRTVHVRPPWEVPMALEAVAACKGYWWRQYFESVEEMMKHLGG